MPGSGAPSPVSDPTDSVRQEGIRDGARALFLLAGTAAFLGVYAGRLARLADRVNEVASRPAGSEPPLLPPDPDQLRYLRRRTLALEIAVILATLSGFFTCMSILSILGGAMGPEPSEPAHFWSSGRASPRCSDRSWRSCSVSSRPASA